MSTNETIVFVLGLVAAVAGLIDVMRYDSTARSVIPMTPIGLIILGLTVAFWAWV